MGSLISVQSLTDNTGHGHDACRPPVIGGGFSWQFEILAGRATFGVCQMHEPYEPGGKKPLTAKSEFFFQDFLPFDQKKKEKTLAFKVPAPASHLTPLPPSHPLNHTPPLLV